MYIGLNTLFINQLERMYYKTPTYLLTYNLYTTYLHITSAYLIILTLNLPIIYLCTTYSPIFQQDTYLTITNLPTHVPTYYLPICLLPTLSHLSLINHLLLDVTNLDDKSSFFITYSITIDSCTYNFNLSSIIHTLIEKITCLSSIFGCDWLYMIDMNELFKFSYTKIECFSLITSHYHINNYKLGSLVFLF